MLFLKAAITIVIFYLISQSIEIDKIIPIVTNANLSLLIVAFILQTLAIFIAGIRWFLVMKKLNFPLPLNFYIKQYFIGMLFSQALPSSIGGDAYRIVALSRRKQSKTKSFYGVLIDRILGLLGLLLIVAIGLILNPDILPKEIYLSVFVALLIGILLILSLLIFTKFSFLKRFKFLQWVFSLSDYFRHNLHGLSVLTSRMFISISIHLFVISCIYCIGLAIGLNQPLEVFLLFVPISLLLTLIPISFAGWGIREGAMVVLFTLVGSPKEVALATSILYGIILILSSLPATYFFLKKH